MAGTPLSPKHLIMDLRAYTDNYGHMPMDERPPLIGEHNLEIYQDELGLSREEIQSLKQSGVI